MKSYSSQEVLKILPAGWYEVNCVGSYHQFKHPVKTGLLFRQPLHSSKISRQEMESHEKSRTQFLSGCNISR